MSSAPITDPRAALAFVRAGNARVTIASKESGRRYTYKVRVSKTDPDFYFVSLLTGPDNDGDYQYIGVITREGDFKTTKASQLNMESAPCKAFTWTLANLWLERIPSALEVWHEGQCGRCARPLTVPESLASGFGPECIQKVGL